MEKISFKDLKDQLISMNVIQRNNLPLKKLFNLNDFLNYILIPKFSTHKIVEWEQMEVGRIEMDLNSLGKYLFEKLEIKECEDVVLILDDMFKSQEAVKFKYGDIHEVEKHYDYVEYSYFLQQFDHIFIFLQSKSIICMHHEGYVWKFKGE